MKLSKELKMWINRMRRSQGKSNGVVKWLWEGKQESMLGTNRKAVRQGHEEEV